MNKVRINLWNREFELVVSFSCYPGECITDIQKDAIMDFCKHTTGIEDALDELKNYIERTFEVVKNLFNFPIGRFKRLVNNFVEYFEK